jgi:hypothetical protein
MIRQYSGIKEQSFWFNQQAMIHPATNPNRTQTALKRQDAHWTKEQSMDQTITVV